MRKNSQDNWCRSMWLMAKQYEKINAPLREQVKDFEKIYSEIKPILPEIVMNRNSISCNDIVDSTMSKMIDRIIQPYQSLIDNINAVNDMLATQFSECVQPQIYIPDMSEILGIAEEVRPWKHDLAVISSYDISVLREQSEFGHLIEMEKAVAGMSKVADCIQEMTSVSAQLASLSQIGLSDSWKDVIVPADLFENLSGFTVQQYEKIQKAVDAGEISWRLDLVDVASKYVDSQVSWWSALAVDSGQDAPESAAVAPDFSELPMLLANSKRDDNDVEEAFENSQVFIINQMGKSIIQKAKEINRCCIIESRNPLFPEKLLLEGALVIVGSFCRDDDSLNKVMSALCDMFIRDPITDIMGWTEEFTDIEKYKTYSLGRKSNITRIQKSIYERILKIEDEIIDSFVEAKLNILDENKLSAKIMLALTHIQGNIIYEHWNENSINDGVRDQLQMIYEVRDQSRHGESVSGKDAGEIDLMVCDSGKPYSIIEGMMLDSIDKSTLDGHISKVLTNYNPIGCPLIYLLIYVKAKRFDDFWYRLTEYIENYSFPYDVVENFRNIPTVYTESGHGKVVFSRNGKKVSFHLFAVKIR